MKLTPEEINQRIAKICGWKYEQEKTTSPEGEVFFGDPVIPNYFGSLDAMHEAEKTLTDEQWMEYSNFLGARSLYSIDQRHMIHAKASRKTVYFLWAHGQNDVEL